ncbi:MAG TPA: HAD-IIA family hydrolase [Acidimicrobiales bacterium]|nr:HAD-IIA family hydrolase [Acidimicrobiales bacterium]
MTWALDLDGVVWLAGEGVPGSSEAVTLLRDAGERVVFLTNNSGPSLAAYVAALGAVGIGCDPADVVTSAQAAASLVAPGETVAVVGDEGVREALAARGAVVVPAEQGPAVVVVGRKIELDYRQLSAACNAIRAGARFIATNTDATFPVAHDTLLPGAGALVAFIATASGHRPEVAGKPHQAMAHLLKARAGEVGVVVGDRPDTDGLFARLTGARFGLVLSGVTRAADLPVEPAPDWIGDDLLALVHKCLGPSEPGRGPLGSETP